MNQSNDDKAAEREESLRSLIRDANLVLAEFKTLMREARKMKDEVAQIAADQFRGMIEEKVEEELEKFKKHTLDAIESSEEAINRRFDTLRDILLGEDSRSKREGRDSIPELIDQLPMCLYHRHKHGPALTGEMCYFREQ